MTALATIAIRKMRRLVWSAVLGMGVCSHGQAQTPSKCLEIESVLVDACNSACAGAQEGENEMFRFIVGPAPIMLNDLVASWATANGFLGWAYNSTTAALTAQLNSTISNCGWLLEPVGGVLPAGKRVLGITSTNLCVPGNSFAELSDTLYVIYQNPGGTFGHFKNTNNGNALSAWPSGTQSFRTFSLTQVSQQCSDSVTYNLPNLVNQYGTYGGSAAENDGSTINVTWPGAPVTSYVNLGCQAPVVPLLAQILTNPVELQCGGSTALTAMATGAVAAVFWTGGTGTFTDAGAYSTGYTLGAGEISGTSVSFCAISACGDTVCDVLLLTVAGASPVSITANGPTAICIGSTVELTATGGTSYYWSTGESGPTISTSTAGTLEVTATNACGSASASIDISVTQPPEAGITAPATTCPGMLTTLVASGDGTYTWENGTAEATLQVSQPGTYTVWVSGPCGTDQATVTIAQGGTVQPTFDLDMAAGCAPHCVQLNVQAEADVTYTWDLGDGSSASGPIVGHCFTAGTYDISLTATPGSGDQRCTGTLVVPAAIEAWPLPQAEFSMDPSVVTLDAPVVRFTDRSSMAATIQWEFGALEVPVGTADSFDHTFSAIGCHPIGLTATSSMGCTHSVVHELCVEDAFMLWAPNGFTPNNDGINDSFNVVLSVRDPKRYALTVYDRWGHAQFSTNDPSQGWLGETAPDGLYTWVVSLVDTDNERQQRTGHVVLLR